MNLQFHKIFGVQKYHHLIKDYSLVINQNILIMKGTNQLNMKQYMGGGGGGEFIKVGLSSYI